MKIFRYPNLLGGRDVLTVVCNKCDLLASEFIENIPLCPDHAAQQPRAMEKKVDVLVHIRKNETGEVRIWKDDLNLHEDGSPNLFMWVYGNYSCDCNRRLFFARVNGEDEDWESDCSNTEYSINVMFGNECIYSEFEQQAFLE